MGQKSNIQTLRLNNRYNTNGINLLAKEKIDAISFIEHLKSSLNKKEIYLIDSSLNFNGNTGKLNLTVFYKSKWLFIKQKTIHKHAEKFAFNEKRLLKNTKKIVTSLKEEEELASDKEIDEIQIFDKKSIINNNTNIFRELLKSNKLFIEVKNLNNIFVYDDNTKFIDELLTVIRPYKNKLFSRRPYLFKDFIKLTCLLIQKEIKTETYVEILGMIFRILPKQSHGTFYKFFQVLLEFLLDFENSRIQGVKFIIHGKLKGKLRSSTANFSLGKIGIQSICSDVDFARTHVYTMYGTFGFHLWIAYNDKIIEKAVKDTRIPILSLPFLKEFIDNEKNDIEKIK